MEIDIASQNQEFCGFGSSSITMIHNDHNSKCSQLYSFSRATLFTHTCTYFVHHLRRDEVIISGGLQLQQHGSCLWQHTEKNGQYHNLKMCNGILQVWLIDLIRFSRNSVKIASGNCDWGASNIPLLMNNSFYVRLKTGGGRRDPVPILFRIPPV